MSGNSFFNCGSMSYLATLLQIADTLNWSSDCSSSLQLLTRNFIDVIMFLHEALNGFLSVRKNLQCKLKESGTKTHHNTCEANVVVFSRQDVTELGFRGLSSWGSLINCCSKSKVSSGIPCSQSGHNHKGWTSVSLLQDEWGWCLCTAEGRRTCTHRDQTMSVEKKVGIQV